MVLMGTEPDRKMQHRNTGPFPDSSALVLVESGHEDIPVYGEN